MQILKIRKSSNHWYPTDYGYSWGGNWLMAGEGRKQVLFGYLHKGGKWFYGEIQSSSICRRENQSLVGKQALKKYPENEKE